MGEEEGGEARRLKKEKVEGLTRSLQEKEECLTCPEVPDELITSNIHIAHSPAWTFTSFMSYSGKTLLLYP